MPALRDMRSAFRDAMRVDGSTAPSQSVELAFREAERDQLQAVIELAYKLGYTIAGRNGWDKPTPPPSWDKHPYVIYWRRDDGPWWPHWRRPD